MLHAVTPPSPVGPMNGPMSLMRPGHAESEAARIARIASGAKREFVMGEGLSKQ
jgi:hypothetical protein